MNSGGYRFRTGVARGSAAASVAALLWLAAVASAAAEVHPRVRFQRLSLREGLSQVTVLALLQDRTGYLWIGTQDGLNRFDGQSVRVFRFDRDDPESLSENLVTGLFEDRDGLIWVLTNRPGALDRYDPTTERFTRFQHDPADPATPAGAASNPSAVCQTDDGVVWIGSFGSGITLVDTTAGAISRLGYDPDDPASLANDTVLDILQDAEGRVWVATFGGGVARWTAGQGFVRYRHDPEDPNGLADDRVTALFQDRSGVLWAGVAGGGLHRWDPAADAFRRFAPPLGDRSGLASMTVPVMAQAWVEDSQGRLWVASNDGVWRLDADRRSAEHFRSDPGDPAALGGGQVTAMLEDQAGVVWIGTRGGLSRFREDCQGFVVFRTDPRDPESLSSSFISAMLVGRSGILWVGTEDGGLASFSRQRHRFTHLAADPTDPEGLHDPIVYGLLVDSAGALWVGTKSGGLHRFDGSRRRVVERYGALPGTGRDIGSDWVRGILEDSRGRFWASSVGGGVCLIDRRRGRVERCYRSDPDDPASLSNDQVQSLFEDSRGQLWVGTQVGWNRFDPESGTFERFLARPGDPTSLVNNMARFTFEDSAGSLWVGTLGGISRFDQTTGAFTSYSNDLDDPASLAHDNVMDMLEGEDGALWIATFGGGLDRFEPATGTFTHHTTRDGLPSDSLYSVVADGQGGLWMSSNNGLSRCNLAAGTFDAFDTDDGLQSTEYSGRSFFRTADGELMFGGINGLTVFRPEEIRSSSYLPAVVLTGFKRQGQRETFPLALDRLERLRLSYRDRYFSFEFAALEFDKPERARFQYMLEGWDSGWVDNGTRRDARYSNVSGGRYRFLVRGSNGDGVWNTAAASIPVVVVPPPWQTPWAYALYVLAGFAAVVLFVRSRIAAQENRRRTEELEAARSIQLSMLPLEPPRLPHLEVAVYMQTATEVGGDYYDFFPQPDGTLYVVTGDATGHGMAAGMMVAMTKTALKAIDVLPPDRSLARLNRVIRAVNLTRLQMALNVLRISGDEVSLSSAGMPPVYLLRGDSGEVEEILVSGVPLGGLDDERYRLHSTRLRPGDTMVLISDGLPERRSLAGEPLGYDAVRHCITAVGPRPAATLIGALIALGERHADGTEPDDDVTIVVVTRRRREPTGATATHA